MTDAKVKIRPYLELCKPRISFSTTLSAGAGFLLAGGRGLHICGVLAGVFLLSCGACSLNQYQERGTDALMPRTAGRPVPSGRIRPFAALAFSTALLLAGSAFLLLWGARAFLFGLCAVLWYNGFYTFLKGRTALAVVPGAVIGALPVAIGWVSAGGNMLDMRILFVCFFFFMWQIPHFWLFAARHGEEYRRAGLPSMTSVFSEEQLARINFIWMSAAGVSCILMIVAGVTRSGMVDLALLGLSLWIIWSGARMLAKKGRAVGAAAFSGINIYMVFVTLVLAADRFI